MFLVTSPIVINLPTRGLLAVECNTVLQLLRTFDRARVLINQNMNHNHNEKN